MEAPTRKRITKDELRLGMYVCGIDGTWLDHPFWKSRFLLSRQSDLDSLRSSAVRGIFIDPSKGLDVAAPAAPASLAIAGEEPFDPAPPEDAVSLPHAAGENPAPEMASTPEMARIEAYAPSFTAGAPEASSLEDELGRAREIVDAARRMVTQLFDEVRLGRAVEADRLHPLVDEIAASIARNRSAMSSMVRLKSKDEYTYMHSVAVSTLMVNLAGELGLSPEETRDAGLAGLLHDIGKMAVPNHLLQKAGALSDREMKLVRTHPARGHAVLVQSVGVPEAALDVCLHHHEKMDGTGYPYRLTADKISLFARMGAVCDVYDAVTSNRPYKAPWTPFEALAKMHAWKGHFDPTILAAFIRSIGIYPVGTLVRLKSGRLAVVKEQTAVPTRPLVRAFASVAGPTDIPACDLDLSRPEKKYAFASMADAIVSAERPQDWNLQDWEQLWPRIIAPSSSQVAP